MQEVILVYNGLEVPTRQILDSKDVIPSIKAVEAKKAIQEMADHSQKWYNGTSTRCRIGTSLLDNALPPKEKDPKSFTLPCYINNLCINKALADLWASVSVMPFTTYTKLGLGELAPTKLIVELANRIVKRPKGIAENVLVRIDKFVFLVDFVVLDMPEDIKTPLILGRPFLSIAHTKIDVFKRKITLRVGNDKVLFKSDKPTSNIIKRVYVLSLRERMELDLEAWIIEKALILNRSLDLLYGDYIKLNDLNGTLELRRNQVDNLDPQLRKVRLLMNL
nr:hypothetical protein [Tanacetum cinerariifolium]